MGAYTILLDFDYLKKFVSGNRDGLRQLSALCVVLGAAGMGDLDATTHDGRATTACCLTCVCVPYFLWSLYLLCDDIAAGGWTRTIMYESTPTGLGQKH